MLQKIFALPKNICMALLSLSVAVLSVGSLFGYFCRFGQIFEIASHFRIIYALGFLICALGFLILRKWKPCLLTIVLFALCDFVPLAQLHFSNAQAHDRSPNMVTVFHANLWGGRNRNYDKTISLLKQRKPDLIGLSEVTPEWAIRLKNGLSDYPYRVVEDRFGGVALFSRYPISESKIEYFEAGTRRRPRIIAKLDVNGLPLTCQLVHPVIPLGKWFKYRNGEFKEIAAEASQISGDKILIGDLNCSPWSSYFAELVIQGGFKDSELGFGAQATWPTFVRFPLIPIDHCLTSESVKTVKRKVGPNIGSDHLPFQVTLALPLSSERTYKKRTI